MALSLLISYSHHPPSHCGDESAEMSSHQMQTLFESAIYFQLTVFLAVQIVPCLP